MNNPAYKRNAEAMAGRMQEEQGLEEALYQVIVDD